jgi:hypothetical protein
VFLNALCFCLQYKHPRSIKESSGQTSQSLQSALSKRQNGDIGRERVKVKLAFSLQENRFAEGQSTFFLEEDGFHAKTDLAKSVLTQ